MVKAKRKQGNESVSDIFKKVDSMIKKASTPEAQREYLVRNRKRVEKEFRINKILFGRLEAEKIRAKEPKELRKKVEYKEKDSKSIFDV